MLHSFYFVCFVSNVDVFYLFIFFVHSFNFVFFVFNVDVFLFNIFFIFAVPRGQPGVE